jgi:hypothetical protein
MNTVKISQLPPASGALSSTDVFPAVQSGTTVKATGAALSVAVFGAQTTNVFTGTGVQVAFTLTRSASWANVYVNGVYQQKNTYSVAGAVLTFSQAPPVTSSIEVNYV